MRSPRRLGAAGRRRRGFAGRSWLNRRRPRVDGDDALPGVSCGAISEPDPQLCELPATRTQRVRVLGEVRGERGLDLLGGRRRPLLALLALVPLLALGPWGARLAGRAGRPRWRRRSREVAGERRGNLA